MITLVTGANGFVGTALCGRLHRDGLPLRKAVRSLHHLHNSTDAVQVGDINADTDWTEALMGVRCVVHLAARVHVMTESTDNPLAEFRRVNVQGALNLARQAAAAGVKRLILVSTVKVNGEATQPGHALVEEDAPYPDDAYGLSKYEAEQRIKQTLDRTGMELVIIRPPLIYGAGVRANFGRMVQCVHGRIPLPLGAIDHNLRSFVFVENLVDFIVTCLEHPAAAQETFFVSDGEDMSTADLLMRIGDAIGKPTRLFYVPIWLLRLGSILIGKRIFYGRLCNSLQVDISKAKRLLAWTPRFSVDEALRRSARWK